MEVFSSRPVLPRHDVSSNVPFVLASGIPELTHKHRLSPESILGARTLSSASSGTIPKSIMQMESITLACVLSLLDVLDVEVWMGKIIFGLFTSDTPLLLVSLLCTGTAFLLKHAQNVPFPSHQASSSLPQQRQQQDLPARAGSADHQTSRPSAPKSCPSSLGRTKCMPT